ncbi:MAG: hypothetical protein PHX43_09345 [Alphaproteobacteria bacterium]|nr:hypothetical protein [Alphaproteobacteria bacterium]
MENVSEEVLKKLSIPVTPLLEQIFISARIRQQDRHRQWIAASHKIASKIPNSLAMCTVQFMGDMDMILLCMEEEIFSAPPGKAEPFFGLNFQMSFSEAWVCKAYEICRALKQRKTAPDTEAFRELFHILEGIRITLDKFEIAKDGKNKFECDLASINPDGTPDLEKVQTYSYKNEKKAHIMPTGLNQRTGALLWVVTHAEDKQSFSVDRRSLSDTFLKFFCVSEMDTGSL